MKTDTATRKNRKKERNEKILKRYHAILKRMGSVRFLTPKYEILEELASDFALEIDYVNRIIMKELKKEC